MTEILTDEEWRAFAAEMRKWWRFDEGQQHAHSWHDREDFIEKALPKLLDGIATRLRDRVKELESSEAMFVEICGGLAELLGRPGTPPMFLDDALRADRQARARQAEEDRALLPGDARGKAEAFDALEALCRAQPDASVLVRTAGDGFRVCAWDQRKGIVAAQYDRPTLASALAAAKGGKEAT